MNPYHPDDRPLPQEQPMRARVPADVSSGAFSTGVIVMTAQTEFILDFVQNLSRPHQIVARVIMPHNVLPQLVDALQRNIDLYRGRWGELPATPVAKKPDDTPPPASASPWGVDYAGAPSQPPAEGDSSEPNASPGATGSAGAASGPGAGGAPGGESTGDSGAAGPPAEEAAGGQAELPRDEASSQPKPLGSGTRQATAQEVYDDLKIKDELLSGAYANAVMIGHGVHEFSFDFITNFYPHSAVSSRVFLAAGQVPRLYDSLKGTWDQMRSRMRKRGPDMPSGGVPPTDLPGGSNDTPGEAGGGESSADDPKEGDL